MKLVIHTDGGARGNPGPAAVGVVIKVDSGQWKVDSGAKKNSVIEFGKRIGEATNNVAEYTAVIEALKVVSKTEELSIDFYLDSLLVVQQLNGIFKIRDARLRELAMKIRMLERVLGAEVQYHYVPRAENSRADFLVNQALDEWPEVNGKR